MVRISRPVWRVLVLDHPSKTNMCVWTRTAKAPVGADHDVGATRGVRLRKMRATPEVSIAALPGYISHPWALNNLRQFFKAFSIAADAVTAPFRDPTVFLYAVRWNWNFYGKPACPHQCVCLLGSGALPECGGSMQALTSFLTVLKRFGAEGAGLLSFPMDGYTLSLDFAMRGRPLFDLLKKLDEIVLQQRGRIYLAKDACLDAETFRAMYPRYRNWQEIKARVDPGCRFRSALSERLGLTPPT